MMVATTTPPLFRHTGEWPSVHDPPEARFFLQAHMLQLEAAVLPLHLLVVHVRRLRRDVRCLDGLQPFELSFQDTNLGLRGGSASGEASPLPLLPSRPNVT